MSFEKVEARQQNQTKSSVHVNYGKSIHVTRITISEQYLIDVIIIVKKVKIGR